MTQVLSFTRFPKIQGLPQAIAEGIVPMGQEWIATEKLDGANTLVERTPNGLLLASRNNIVAFYNEENPGDSQILNPFNGFVDYVFQRSDLFLKLEQGVKLYGEWLIPHTLQYPDEMWRHFYAFDRTLGNQLGLFTVPLVGLISANGYETPAELFDVAKELLAEYTKAVGRKTEGLVMRRYDADIMSQKFKVFSPDFKETAKVKSNPKKATDLEIAAAGYYPVRAYQKVCLNVRDLNNGVLSMRDTPQILGRCSHDYFTEYFPLAIKAMKYPILNTALVKKEVEGRVREMFISEQQQGILPQWAVSELYKEGATDE